MSKLRVFKVYEEWNDTGAGGWEPVVDVTYGEYYVDDLRLGSAYGWLNELAIALRRRRTKDARAILKYIESLQDPTDVLPSLKFRKKVRAKKEQK